MEDSLTQEDLALIASLLRSGETLFDLATFKGVASEQPGRVGTLMRESAVEIESLRSKMAIVLHNLGVYRDKFAEQDKYFDDCVQEGIEEAKTEADHFEKECWIGVKRLLQMCPGFSWADYDDAITADEAFNFLREHLEYLYERDARLKSLED